MATLQEITYNIKDIIEGGRSTQDSPFSLRQIAFFVIYYRALLVRRETNYFKRMDGLEQDLGLVDTEISEHSVGRGGELPKVILRTSGKIPQPVRMRTRKPITFVGSPDLDEQYPFGERGQARYQSYERYTSNDSRSFWHDGRIYITSDKIASFVNETLASDEEADVENVEESINTIRIKGIFADPREAWSFRYDEPYDWETELPSFPEDLIQRITQSILNGEGVAMVQQILDTELDRLPVNQEPGVNEAPRQS